MPDMDPTHLLTLYYAKERKMGWHRDDGSNDGQSEQPVVSLSVGNSCEFEVKHDQEEGPRSIRLNSGDIILFGGPCRQILHSVAHIYADTAAKELVQTANELTALAPSNEYAAATSYRLNFTFRHAPELSGKENEPRFFQLGSKGRVWLDGEHRGK